VALDVLDASSRPPTRATGAATLPAPTWDWRKLRFLVRLAFDRRHLRARR
jgi:hypothetical protein